MAYGLYLSTFINFETLLTRSQSEPSLIEGPLALFLESASFCAYSALYTVAILRSLFRCWTFPRLSSLRIVLSLLLNNVPNSVGLVIFV